MLELLQVPSLARRRTKACVAMKQSPIIRPGSNAFRVLLELATTSCEVPIDANFENGEIHLSRGML